MFSHRDTEEQGNEFSPDLSKPSRGHESVCEGSHLSTPQSYPKNTVLKEI